MDKQQYLGRRLELSPATDLWMMGARFGTVVGFAGDDLLVRMDHPRVKQQRVPLSLVGAWLDEEGR